MSEQDFLESLKQSMREIEQLQFALGRSPQRATLDQALAQVRMLCEARQECFEDVSKKN